MKHLLRLAAVVSILAVPALVYSQSPGAKKSISPQSLVLQPDVGTWDAVITAGGMESAGTLTVEAGPGGNGIVSHLSADFGGRPFEGRGFDAWDPSRGKYVGLWMYSLSEQPLFFEGVWDAETKTRTSTVQIPDARTGVTKRETHVTRVVSDDERDFRILFDLPGGKQGEMLAIRYKRRK